MEEGRVVVPKCLRVCGGRKGCLGTGTLFGEDTRIFFSLLEGTRTLGRERFFFFFLRYREFTREGNKEF